MAFSHTAAEIVIECTSDNKKNAMLCGVVLRARRFLLYRAFSYLKIIFAMKS